MSRRPETRPEHCFDWITPDEAVRMAVRAFAVARQHTAPQPGEPFVDPADGYAWTTREDFANNLSEVFAMQVRALAFRLDIGRDHFEQDAVRLAKWGVEPSPAPVVRNVCRGPV
jgi:hypothetical protein